MRFLATIEEFPTDQTVEIATTNGSDFRGGDGRCETKLYLTAIEIACLLGFTRPYVCKSTTETVEHEGKGIEKGFPAWTHPLP